MIPSKMGSGYKVIVHGVSSEFSLPDFTNLFLKYGDVMTAFLNTRNAYEGKISGYVVFKSREGCVEAIAQLNSKPPHYLNLQPAVSLDDVAQFDGNNLDHTSAQNPLKFLRSAISQELHSRNNDSNYNISKVANNIISSEKGAVRKILPANKFPKSGATSNPQQMTYLGSGSRRIEGTNSMQIRTTKFHEAQSEKAFCCKDNFDKVGKVASELQQKSRDSSRIDLSEKQSKPPKLNETEDDDRGRNSPNYQSLRSSDAKYTPSINETTPIGKEKSQGEKGVTSGGFSNEKINKEKNGIITSTTPDKVTAKDIRNADFKRDSSRDTMKISHLFAQRCSTWGLLSHDPKTQIVNYDLCTQQMKLSADSFTEVVIYRHIGHGEYWVHCKNALGNLRFISESLFSKALPAIPCKPSVGEYYSVKFENTCFRCKVLSSEESKAMVLLIDFGIIIECEVSNLSELAEMTKNYCAQAIHVKLDPWTPEKYLVLKKGDTLIVKAVEMDGETTKVQVDGILYSQISSFPESFISNKPDVIDESNSDGEVKVKVHWPPSVLNFLKLGQEVTCTVLKIKMNDEEQKDELIVAIANHDMSRDMDRILSDFPKMCLHLPDDHSFRPAIGELIAAYYEAYELWVRAVVLSEGLNRWLVASCDFGVILEVKKIHKMPIEGEFSKIPSFATRCKISYSWLPRDDLFSEEWIEESSSLWMKVCKREDKYFKCQLGLVKGSPLCEVSVAIWVPQTDKPIFCNFSSKTKGLRNISLPSGTDVRIVSYYMSLVMHVQPWSKESQQKIEHLHDNINNLVDKSEPLKVVPVVGKMYICTFMQDMKHYRAIVNKVRNLEQIDVTYVDYGNSDMVPLSNFYEISHELEVVPCFAVKIGLKRKFSRLLNQKALIFLSSLAERNEELTLICPDGNLRRCDLLRPNGYLLSDILKELVDPSSEIKS